VPVVVLPGSFGAYREATCLTAWHLEELSQRKPALQELAPSLVLLFTYVHTYCAASQLQMWLWRWSTYPVIVFGYKSQKFFSPDLERGHGTKCVGPMQSFVPSHDIRPA